MARIIESVTFNNCLGRQPSRTVQGVKKIDNNINNIIAYLLLPEEL